MAQLQPLEREVVAGGTKRARKCGMSMSSLDASRLSANEARRRGACDFIQKPWDNERLLAAIRKQAESERRRKSELEIAANVQQKLFPRKLRILKTLDYSGQCVAAREVGGDYYDFLDTGD